MNGGLLGLTHRTNKRAAAQQDRALIAQMYQTKKQEDAENQAAILAQQDLYDKINQQTFALLENDRSAINKKAHFLQEKIRRQMKLYGNNRAEFMKNGGMKMLMEYKNSILGSEEFMKYKNNKNNMEKILAIREKGLGARMTEQDIINLKNYEKYGTGDITYHGLLNEIKIDPTLYDYGHEITPLEIMRGNNRMNIIANMVIEDPNLDPAEITESQMYNYIKEKGYGGRGTDKSKLKYENQLNIANAYRKRYSNKSNNNTGSSNYKSNKVYNSKNFNLGIYDLSQRAKKYTLGTFTAQAAHNENINSAFGSSPVEHIGINKYGMNSTLLKFRPAGYVVEGSSFGTQKIGKEILRNYYDEDHFDEQGKFILDINDQDVYDAQGESGKKTKDNNPNIEYQDNFTPGKPIIAFKSKIGGEDIIKVRPVNKDGTTHKSNKEMYGDKKSNATGSITVVIPLTTKNKAGQEQTYYVEVDPSNINGKKAFELALGTSNDVKNVIAEEQINKYQYDMEALRQGKMGGDNNSIAIEKTYNAERQIQTNPELTNKYENYTSNLYKDSDGKNRSLLIKAMMMSIAMNYKEQADPQNKTPITEYINSFIDNNMISQIFDTYNLTYKANDLNISDMELLQELYNKSLINENADLTDEEIHQMNGFASLIKYTKQIYNAKLKK